MGTAYREMVYQNPEAQLEMQRINDKAQMYRDSAQKVPPAARHLKEFYGKDSSNTQFVCSTR